MNIIEEDCLSILKSVNLRPLKNKRVLLTGANGFLGQYLVELIHLANTNQNLRCTLEALSLHGPNRFLRRLLPSRYITFKRANLAQPFTIRGKFDYIVHAACYGQPSRFIANPFSTIFLNTEATRRLLEVARVSRAKFVFFSSAEIYGNIPRNLRAVPETYNGSYPTISLRAVYGESKRLGETICYVFKNNCKVDVKIIRPSHLYGPGISIYDKRVLGDFMRGALLEKRIRLKDEGRAVKTYGYIADAIKMIMHVMFCGQETVYNVGGVDTVSIRKLAKLIGDLLGVKVEGPRRKSDLNHVGGDPAYLKLDLSRILSEMEGFSFTPLSVGLQRTIEWNKKEFKI